MTNTTGHVAGEYLPEDRVVDYYDNEPAGFDVTETLYYKDTETALAYVEQATRALHQNYNDDTAERLAVRALAQAHLRLHDRCVAHANIDRAIADVNRAIDRNGVAGLRRARRAIADVNRAIDRNGVAGLRRACVLPLTVHTLLCAASELRGILSGLLGSDRAQAEALATR